MEEQVFKAGDVVRQKSGGPLMTVEAADSTSCCCIWWPIYDNDWAQQPETADFRHTSLVKSEG